MGSAFFAPFPTEKNKHSWFKKLLSHWKELPNLYFSQLPTTACSQKMLQTELCELSEIGLPLATNCMRWRGISIFKGISQNENRKNTSTAFRE
jgi:hypothetical protein